MASTSAVEPSSPNWLEIPHDLMANILQRLGTVEILKSARKVCANWRIICNDPAMWKVIHGQKSLEDWDANYYYEMLTKQAVDLSCGELIDICIVFFGSNDLLDYIVLRSNKLKRLHLLCCEDITGSGLIRAVKRLPQLEELRLSYTCNNAKIVEAVGQNCPQLKSFLMEKRLLWPYVIVDDEDALAIANNMHELRHLDLYNTEITNNGLQAILNGCPHLQFLDVRMCPDLNLDGTLGKQCMERIKYFMSDLTQN